MTITYTTNYNFPLLGAGSDGWAATINGMMTDLDRIMAETANPLIWEDDGSDYVLITLSGVKTTTELLTFNGEILGYA